MKTVSNTSSLMELAESRNNVTASSNEGDSQEDFYAIINMKLLHGTSSVDTMTNFSDLVNAYNRGANIYLNVAAVSYGLQPVMTKVPLDHIEGSSSNISAFVFKGVSIPYANTFQINMTTWRSDQSASVNYLSAYPGTESPYPLNTTKRTYEIDSNGIITY